MPFKDPEKRRAYRRRWYNDHAKSEIAHVTKRKNNIRKWILNYKSTLSCSKCGESHPAILDFHHTGNKEKTISDMILNGNSIEKIKKEIANCKALCSNCHRKIHFKEQKSLKA